MSDVDAKLEVLRREVDDLSRKVMEYAARNAEYPLSLQEALEHAAKGGKVNHICWSENIYLTIVGKKFDMYESITNKPDCRHKGIKLGQEHLTGWKIVDI